MTPATTMDDATARAAVLRAADQVFYERGIAGTGMAEIRDVSGVSLRRLYVMYPSKGELTEAWLRDRHETWMAWFGDSVERLAADGRDPLLATFDAIAEWAAKPRYRGCAFVNTAAEPGEIDDRHRAVIAQHKRDLIAYLGTLARGAGHRRPKALAEAIAVLLDGAMVESAVLATDRPIAAARSAAQTVVAAHR